MAIWAAFWPIAWVLPRHNLFDLVNALTVAVAIGVLVAYAPAVRRSLMRNDLSGSHYLVLGIACTWAATSVRHVWNWAWRYMDKPDAMIDNPIVAFLIWVMFTGGALHLTARDAIDGHIPSRNWVWLGVVVAVALACAMLVALLLEPGLRMEAVP